MRRRRHTRGSSAARSWAGGVAVAGFAAMVVATAVRALHEETWDEQIGVHPTTIRFTR